MRDVCLSRQTRIGATLRRQEVNTVDLAHFLGVPGWVVYLLVALVMVALSRAGTGIGPSKK